MRDELKLENQLCFKVHRLSRVFIKLHQPILERLDVTYPQYLVLLVLWEDEVIDYQELANRLELKTGTLTPIIQRLEKRNLASRRKNPRDLRRTEVFLLEKGAAMGHNLDSNFDHITEYLSELNTERLRSFSTQVDEISEEFMALGVY